MSNLIKAPASKDTAGAWGSAPGSSPVLIKAYKKQCTLAGFKMFCKQHDLKLRTECEDPTRTTGTHWVNAYVSHRTKEPVHVSTFSGMVEWILHSTYTGQLKKDTLIMELLQSIEPHEGRTLRFGSPEQEVKLPNLRKLYLNEASQWQPLTPTEVDF